MGNDRLSTITVVFLSVVFGCSKADVPSHPSSAGLAKSARSSPPFADLPVDDMPVIRDISPPGPSDHACVAKLDQSIIHLAEEYVERHYRLCQDSAIEKKARVVAARRVRQYVLLDVDREGFEDGHIHLVCSEKARRILGRFRWEVQG